MKKVGLVLSGGGAKGAYEVGVWKALDIMGILPYIDGIYGTSVGALNAALLDTCGTWEAQNIWLNFKKSDFFNVSTDKSYAAQTGPNKKFSTEQLFSMVGSSYINEYLTNINMGIMSWMKAVVASVAAVMLFSPFGFMGPAAMGLLGPAAGVLKNFANYFALHGLPLSQEGINQLIKDRIDFSRQHRTIVAFCMKSRRPHQVVPFDLQQYDANVRRKILLASSAIPYIYQGTVTNIRRVEQIWESSVKR